MRGARPHAAIEAALQHNGVVLPGERVLVACSGGPDSVALSAALRAVATPMRLTLAMVHVNHSTRTSAWQDECVALRVAAALDVPIRVVALEAQERRPSEQRLRDARYAVLGEVARSVGAGAIALGHHAEDQSESVLLALFRGTGAAGLRGMRARRSLAPGVDLVRPLLRFDANALRGYCHREGLPYAIDPTNEDAELRRNAVRRALAGLRPAFTGLDRAIARCAELSDPEAGQTDLARFRTELRERLGREGELRDVSLSQLEAAALAMARGRSGRFVVKSHLSFDIVAGRITGMTRG